MIQKRLRNLKRVTLHVYEKAVKDLFEFCGDLDIDHQLINRFLYHLSDQLGYTGQGLAGYRSKLAMFFKFCERFRYVEVSPMLWVSFPAPQYKPRTTRYSHEDYLKLRAAARLEMRTAVALAYRFGLRQIDIAFLRWTSVDLEQGLLTYEPIKTKWLGSVCRVPIASGSDVMEDLMEMRKLAWNEWVFPDFSRNLHKRRVRACKRLRDLCNKAGVKYLGWHPFRRSAISNLCDAGVSPHEVMRIVGLRSLETLLIYFEPSERALRTAIERTYHFTNQ